MLEQQLDPVAAADLGRLGHPVDQPAPRLGIGGLERIVVALAARPDDQVRAQRAREVGRLANDPSGLTPQLRVGVHQPPAAKARIEMQSAGDAVHVVVAERRAHLVEVVGREFVGVVELVPVDQIPQALDRAVDLLGHRLGHVVVAGLIAAGHEAGDHRPERPDAEAGLQHGGRLALTST